MNLFAEITIFETAPEKSQSSGAALWGDDMRPAPRVPRDFLQEMLLLSDVVALVLAVLIVFNTTHFPFPVIAGIEALFLMNVALIILSRSIDRFRLVLALYLSIMLFSGFLNILGAGTWGDYGFFILCLLVWYRFPLRWSLPLVAASSVLLLLTNGLIASLLTRDWNSLVGLVPLLLALLFFSWTGWVRRGQYLLLVKLQEAQAQEMARAQELAAIRERTRIARDIHDVLAHSLSVLSIQTQAARVLVSHDPGRLEAKLDEMATLLRESMAESRRVVGILRSPDSSSENDLLPQTLRTAAERFSAWTGIRCLVEEEGTAHPLTQEQKETLHYALRESLTNAYRHGAAHTIWISLHWLREKVILQIRDDGKGATTSGALFNVREPEAGHGLQGMRERASELGGVMEAHALPKRGFLVTISVPFLYNDASTRKDL